MNITLSFTVRHLAYVASIFKNYDIAKFYRTAVEIKTKAAGKNLTEIVSVTVPATAVVRMYRSLSEFPEGIAAEINKEIQTELMAQLTVKAGYLSLTFPTTEQVAEGQAAMVVIGGAQAKGGENTSALNQLINSGLAWINEA